MEITHQSIGIIHSPFKTIESMPIQPSGASNIQGSIEIFSKFAEGLKDIEGFSHIFLLYHFHKVKESKLIVTPFMDSQARGIFATRAPKRPNPIGLSVVKLLSVEQNILHIGNVDIVDCTPLLDIKPYVPEFDVYKAESIGWLQNVKGQSKNQKSDDRFR